MRRQRRADPFAAHSIVVGYPPKDNNFMFNSTLNFKLYDLIRQFASGKP